MEKEITEIALYNYVVDKAESYGLKAKNDRNAISKTTEKGNAIIRHNTSPDGAYFGFIRNDQSTSGKYQGLSFVVFPHIDTAEGENTVQKKCVISIGIGSATLGDDTAMASSPGIRRTFMKLQKCPNCQFFFMENWNSMDGRNPGLREEVEKTHIDPLIKSVISYDDNSTYGREGLLPAACLIDFETNTDGLKIIDAWLAMYAQWRLWDTTDDARKKIVNAINACTYSPKTNKELEEEIAQELLGLNNPSLESDTHMINRYLILQGAPGCGKTRMALSIADDYFAHDNVLFTQFHAETTYADFVYGIKPVLDGKTLAYEEKTGVLLDAIAKAYEVQAKEGKNENNDNRVLLVIDEINRANLANVLGPVFYLFEANAQGHNYTIKIGEKEYNKLPDNLYVIATMNTADRSLAVVDFALRRRFIWYTLFPKFLQKDDIDGLYFNGDVYNEFNILFEKYATDEELHLQPGHSYFITKQKVEVDSDGRQILNEEMKSRLQYELMPLMKEYFNEGFMLGARDDFAHLFYKYTKEYIYK